MISRSRERGRGRGGACRPPREFLRRDGGGGGETAARAKSFSISSLSTLQVAVFVFDCYLIFCLMPSDRVKQAAKVR